MTRRAEIVRLYAEGGSLRSIADTIGCSHEAVRQNLHKAGVQLRPRSANDGRRPGRTSLTDEVYADLASFPDGATVQQLSEWIGERRATITRALAALIANGKVKLVRAE